MPYLPSEVDMVYLGTAPDITDILGTPIVTTQEIR
jgi:hypothetical protein